MEIKNKNIKPLQCSENLFILNNLHKDHVFLL